MRVLMVVVAAVAACFTGPQRAGSEESDSTIVACAHVATGRLRLVADESECRRKEQPLTWSREGGPGPAGPPGPEGPAGPVGPAGPEGPSATGARLFLVSSGSAAAVEDGTAVVVPGLQATVTVAEGSSIAVHVDVRDHTECAQFVCCTSGALKITQDGEAVISRYLAGFFGGNSGAPEDYGLHWLSAPLAQGSYTIALEVEANIAPPSNLNTTNCVGSGGGADDQFEARMTIIELRS